jgi:DNA-directed RNA polymerase specialized sigma24 family protein
VPSDPPRRPSAFPETRWTTILAARGRPDLRRKVMQELCAHRWHALYACARRQGLAADRAEDAVQGLLLQLFERDFLDRLDPERGSLRSYLKQALRHYLVNEHEREGAVKRGGGHRALPIDGVEARLPSAPDDPERAFDREWALAIFEGALGDLESEYSSGARTGPVEVLRELFRFGEASPYEKLAADNGMTVPQLKSFVHRARLRFKELLLVRIADTVGSEREAVAELEDLLRAMAS